MNTTLYLETSFGKIAYCKYGTGAQIILAFHGFGLDKSIFEPLSVALKDSCIYSFDLFHHGESFFTKTKNVLEYADIEEMFNRFLFEQQIDTFELIAYSLGGKMALAVVELFPNKCTKLTMIAADGWVLSPWYTFATGTVLGRYFLKYLVLKPNIFFTLTKLLHSLKLIPYSTIRFAELNMGRLATRKQIYNTWLIYRNLKVDTQKMSSILNKYGITVEFIFGKQDHIIKHKKIVNSSNDLQKRTITYFECSHSKVLQFYIQSLR